MSKSVEKADAAKKKSIVKKYVDLIKSSNMFPTRAELAEAGISRDILRYYFVNLSSLRKQAKKEFPEAFGGVINADEYATAAYEKKLSSVFKKHKRFVITTAVTGQWVHTKFLDSINAYCKRNDAQLLILPSHDPAHNLDNSVEWHFDDAIADAMFVFTEMPLNSNIHISDLRIAAKQINPTTGLGRIAQGKGSFIFASPKQSLEFDPVSNVKYPHARMSTGACTLPNYRTSKINSLRTAYLAENDHVMGALIVEIEDAQIYHFRQVQADFDGGFCDLGKYYLGKNCTKVPASLIMGDYHAGEHDEETVKAWEELIDELSIERVFFHDLFNGKSINHHEEHNIVLRARHAKTNLLNLENELRITGEQIDRIMSHKSVKKGIIVKSNHDEFLQRWLENGKFKYDPINFQAGCRLADKMVDGNGPLQEGLKLYGKIKTWNRIQFLQRDEDYKIAGVECGAHGDKGPNGSRGTKASLENAYGKCIIAHSHTPGILRGVYQVGTSSLLDLGYNSGPSSWLHTSCLIYPNGQRQLINSIEGNWKLK